MHPTHIRVLSSSLCFALTLLSLASSAAEPLFSTRYDEAVHIRKLPNGILAPETISINPTRHLEYRLAFEYSDDYEALAQQSGIQGRVRDLLLPAKSYLEGQLSCDFPFTTPTGKRAKTAMMRIPKRLPGSPIRVLIHPQTRKCTLTKLSTFEVSKEAVQFSPVKNKIDFETLPSESNLLSQLETQAIRCRPIKLQADRAQDTHLIEAFNAIDHGQTTCAHPIRSIDLLEHKIDGLQGKMELLLGQPLSHDFLNQKDPFAELDFSKAPHLDAILISYLVFRADFTGTLIARALEHHARQGTQVRILVSSVISLTKDKALFDRLMAVSPNIKIQQFAWSNVRGSGDGSPLSQLHRTNHTKLFMTLSRTQPELNAVIHGGRNIHDGFALGTSVKFSPRANFQNRVSESTHASSTLAWPYVEYGDDLDESWASWRDFEFKIQDTAMVYRIAEHFLRLWNRDVVTGRVPEVSKSLSPQQQRVPKETSLAKHIVSVPYQDGYLLKDLYVKLIDSARSEILITSPYLRPPREIVEALDRAVQRGVDLKIITRIDLQGDTADDFLEEVNKTTINRLFDRAQIFEYTVPGEILHSKLMIIDRKLSFVSSVNLNHRSFLHDLEDGILIYGPEFSESLLRVVADYQSSVRRVDAKVPTVWWRKVIVDLAKGVF